MTDAFIRDEVIRGKYGLTDGLTFEDQFSTVSIESILFSVFATAMWIMQQLFEQFGVDTSEILANQTPGNADWYVTIKAAFCLGKNKDYNRIVPILVP